MPNEQWYGVYDKATGQLVSVGTVLADPLPDNLLAEQLSGIVDFAVDEWDSTSRKMKKKPKVTPKDRVDDIMNDPEIDLVATVGLEKATLKAILIRQLPEFVRFYEVR